jgi:hypothetical protein
MVTHELTVFPDGRIDGAFSVREGDYNSHTLRFVLTQDLTAASAKLLLWPAGAEKPTVYGVLLGHGQAAGQDVQFTPVSWGKAPSRTQIQLELLDNNGNIIWQSRRLRIPVEPGIPDDALPEPVDTSDATAGPGDVALGKTFYAQGEKKTGSYVSDGIQPRAWADIPIDYILCEIEESENKYYFQRVSSSEFMLVVPQDDVGTAIATFAVDETTDIYMEGIKVGEATDEVPLTLTLDMGQPISIGLKWRKNSKEALISVTVLREDSENACLEVKEIHAGRSTTLDTANPDVHIVTRKGEVFYYYQFPTLSGRTYVMVKPSGLLKVALQIVQGNESNGVGAGTYVKLYKESDENFVLFELTTPSGKYRKKYCVSWRASDTIVFSASLYTYPVLAFIDGDSQFYNYAAFPPKEPHAEYALLKQTVNKFWAEKVPKDRYGRVLLNFSQTVDLEDFTDSADYTAKNAVIDTLKTVQIGCNITEKENLLSVGPQYAMLGKNSLTDASRWIMLINGRLVDMPGFLMHTWPDNSEIITFIYTCADGLDVGYPYAGE